MFKKYYLLTKPGIVRGNVFTAMGGFFLASRGTIDIPALLGALFGTAFIIASGCIFNNYIDRDIDSKMVRTQKRALVTGAISSRNALLFGALLGIVGVITLLVFTNLLSCLVAVTGFIFYVVVYGYFKRASVYGTLIGSISGAIPPVIGYTAATHALDLGAVVLFLILVAWQMPHFYAIGIFRKDDYEMAGLPILPVKKGFDETKKHMIFFAALFLFGISLLTLFGYTGYLYLIVMFIVGGLWVGKILQKEISDQNMWAKKVFGLSIVVLSLFSVIISIDFALPF